MNCFMVVTATGAFLLLLLILLVQSLFFLLLPLLFFVKHSSASDCSVILQSDFFQFPIESNFWGFLRTVVAVLDCQ